MPELPDIEVYVEQIAKRVVGDPIESARVASPFVVRTFDPPIRATFGKRVLRMERLGKRIVFALEEELYIVVHLMIAGRFRWRTSGAKVPGKIGLAAFDFPKGTLVFTEASPKKRASIHVLKGEVALRAMDPGGVDPLTATLARFREALLRESHTVKRALTDPHLFSGIGNAYSDEILFHAKMAPTKLTGRMSDDEIRALHKAVKGTLRDWVTRLRKQAGDEFPEEVTAFREEMAVHGKYNQPCPVCGAKIQRIRYADNEANYCAPCQTGGKLLADRGISRLLKSDWPKTLEELEERKAGK